MQEFKFVNVGFGSVVAVHQILAIHDSDSAGIKRHILEAKSHQCLLDATYGRRTRSVLITHSGYVILSSIQLETLSQRLHNS
jgi:extracellular matrix regulatory protein A